MTITVRPELGLGVASRSGNMHASLCSDASCTHAAGVAPPEDTQHQTIQTARGEALLQFAMSPTAVGDDVYLYEQLIEPELKSGAPRMSCMRAPAACRVDFQDASC